MITKKLLYLHKYCLDKTAVTQTITDKELTNNFKYVNKIMKN